jgi:hypothetical protein
MIQIEFNLMISDLYIRLAATMMKYAECGEEAQSAAAAEASAGKPSRPCDNLPH